MSETDPYSEFVSRITLGQVLLYSINAERKGRSPIADEEDSEGWGFSVIHEISDNGLEMNVRVHSRAENSTMAVTLQHQLQYDFTEPVHDLDKEIAARFIGESVIVTVAPYIRELVHGLGMRMHCDVPWLNIVGPQDLTPGG